MFKVIVLFFGLFSIESFATVKLNFIVDENYLIVYTMAKGRSSGEFSKDVKLFQNEVYEKFKKEYKELQKIPLSKITPSIIKNDQLQFIIKILPKIKELPSYNKLFIQTIAYRNDVQVEWLKNFDRSSREVFHLTGVQIEGTFNIYITHPAVRNGTNLGNNEISWGSWGDWENYSTIYLWHEILHNTLKEKSNIEHCVIQFVADHELRKRLSKIEYPPYIGHQRLLPSMKLLQEDWNNYISTENRNIIEFSKKMHEKFRKQIQYF